MRFFILAALLFPALGHAGTKVRLCAGGDILLDRGIRRHVEKAGVHSPFAAISPLINGHDLAIANLECPVSTSGYYLGKKYSFDSPPEYLVGLSSAGFNLAIVANNHTIDRGREAFLQTLGFLTRAGITPIGGGRTQTEARKATIIERNGLKIAFLASVDMLLEGLPFIEDLPAPAWSTTEQLTASIKELRDMVDFIVVSQHWGVQFQEVPTYNQRARAKALIDAGADLILGHHPHVLQGIEFYNDRPILYSLGNLIFDQYLAPTQRSMLATFVLEKGRPPIPILTPLILKDGVPRKAENEERASLSKHLQRLSSSLDAHFIETAEGVAALPSQPLLKAVTGKANTAILAGEILFFGENPIDFERLPVSPGKKVQSVIRSNDTNFTSFYMIEASTSLPGEKSISSIKVSSCGIVDAFADEQRLGPWKLVLADVNGDGDTELCVGVKKSTRYDRSIKNRIFVFNRDNAVFWPKWLGSDLNMDFVDFDFSAPGADGRQKLLLLGDCGENRMCIAEYNWNGFGFTGPKIIVRGLLPGNTSNWQTLGRGPEDETPLKQ